MPIQKVSVTGRINVEQHDDVGDSGNGEDKFGSMVKQSLDRCGCGLGTSCIRTSRAPGDDCNEAAHGEKVRHGEGWCDRCRHGS